MTPLRSDPEFELEILESLVKIGLPRVYPRYQRLFQLPELVVEQLQSLFPRQLLRQRRLHILVQRDAVVPGQLFGLRVERFWHPQGNRGTHRSLCVVRPVLPDTLA